MTAPPSVPPLTMSVVALCDDLASVLPADLSPQVRGIRGALRCPLRVALGGEISAGKSMLLNAPLGRRVAEKGPGTTQRPTTAYRAAAADAPESVTLRLTEGTINDTGFGPDGTLPPTTAPRSYGGRSPSTSGLVSLHASSPHVTLDFICAAQIGMRGSMRPDDIFHFPQPVSLASSLAPHRPRQLAVSTMAGKKTEETRISP